MYIQNRRDSSNLKGCGLMNSNKINRTSILFCQILEISGGKIEKKAKEQGNDLIYSDVSITARGFFERHGYVVEKEQFKKSRNKDLINFRMTKKYFEIIIESLKYCQKNKGLYVFGYVIMLNHFHLIAQTETGIRFQDVMRDMKKYTSKAISNELEKDNANCFSMFLKKRRSMKNYFLEDDSIIEIDKQNLL